MECYVSDILTTMDSLNIERSAFIGYSDGGRVGFELAFSHPDRITHLVSLGSVGSMDEEEKQGRKSLADSVRISGVQNLIGYFEKAEGIRFPEWLCDQFRTTDSEMFALELLAWGTWPGAWDHMAEIQVPVLLLVGDGEDPDGLAHIAERILPKGKAITLAGKGHLGAFLATDEVLANVIPFLT
jgi:pimeloyl-ACP methyl ester carboxylesterase